MYEEPSSEAKVKTQAYTNQPQRVRNIPVRLQDYEFCVFTSDNMVNHKAELMHCAFYVDSELVSVI